MRARGWGVHVAVPRRAHIRTLPEGWQYALTPPATRENSPQSVARFARSLRAYLAPILRNHNAATDQNIIFLETFALPHLVALIVALLGLPRKQVSVWLLYRFGFQNRQKARVYRVLNWVLAKLLHGQLLLLTDSALMQTDLHNTLNRRVELIPVVPTLLSDLTPQPPVPREDHRLWCWWPGRPLPEKGFDDIQRFTQTQACSQDIVLLLDETPQLQKHPQGCEIKPLPNGLPRADYLSLLNQVEAVLLPYQPSTYGKRTSGIFTEAISLGKTTFVTPNTWAAHELARFGLSEWVLDWHRPDLLCEIKRLCASSHLKTQLAHMQDHYRAYHCQHGFGEAFEALR